MFFAQGWNVARDRLWQLDLWRKRGLGLLAESFGPAYAVQDRAARLFLYRGDMDAEWAAYGPDAKGWSTAFVVGLNAYVELVRTGAAPLPVEFTLTGSAPASWAAEDLVRIRSHGLMRNADSEGLRARVIAAGGLGADRLRRKLEPEHELIVPEGLDLAEIPADILADHVLATQTVSFAAAGARTPTGEEGSNNWAIAPSRTATGRAILASDPHRVLVAPSIRYIAHLDAPGLKVIGAGEPHLPGVTIGHNERVAFGITIFPVDQEDICVYELNPQNPRQYRYAGGWEDMRIIRESLAVKGGAPREIELAFTRHGPVVKSDPATRRAFAIRTVWNEPGTASYFGAVRYQKAAEWTEFKAALAHWGAASMNFAYADIDGNIGWATAGKVPVRDGFDGLLPAPGDGRYEWSGFLDPDDLPSLYNPERGWIATANEMNLPPGYPAQERKISFEWADPSRAIRIEEALSANGRQTLADSMALQMDATNVTARRAVALLAGLSSPDRDVDKAIAWLRAWDGRQTTESAAAAIAEVWIAKHLTMRTIERATNAKVAVLIAGASPTAMGSPYAVICYLEAPDSALGEDPAGARAEILLASLRSALDELTGRLGGEMERWTWGALHRAWFTPAAAVLADPDLRAAMTSGPAPVVGSSTTPCASTYRMDDFLVTNGASVRLVMDVGAWDNSMAINTPGQSGDPASPHYRDLFPLWAEGRYVPLLFSRPAVEAAARLVITLKPAS